MKSTMILVLALVLRLYFVCIKNYNINIVFFVQGVQQDLVEAWLGQLTSQPRATQLLPKDHSLHSNLEEAMSRYLKDVKRTTFKADKTKNKSHEHIKQNISKLNLINLLSSSTKKFNGCFDLSITKTASIIIIL